MLPACQQAFIVVKITFQCITKEEKNLNTTIIIVSENKKKTSDQSQKIHIQQGQQNLTYALQKEPKIKHNLVLFAVCIQRVQT